jgi:asparagine synthase (glutamine-hydrolysing)
MCGFIGRINFDGQGIQPELIQKMTDRIKHRGPDSQGIYVKDHVGLGHRRLSIIDLSPDGAQPMSNKDQTVWIVFNGEIYDFQKLRDDLIEKGYEFQSKSDTEVIIYLYEEYGEKCVEYLRGMFTIVIWDTKKQRIFMARDRAGQKPLKYYLNDKFIAFGSELKSLLLDPDVPKEIDLPAINHYLTLQYVPHPATGFKGIKKLPAGHTMTIDLNADGTPPKVEIKPYWELSYETIEKRTEKEWVEKIRESLEESVRLRMISDVPLGAFLSGGLDSSAVVAMMAKHSSTPVKTFSIGFNEKKYNELPFARKVAQQFKTDHKEFIVEPEALKILPKLIDHYEEPYADSSAIPTWYLSEMTKEHVSVALNGDGGDENFAGYGTFPIHLFAEKVYGRIPKILRKALVIPSTRLFHKVMKNTLSERCRRFAESFETAGDSRYLRYVSYFTPEQKAELYRDDFKEEWNQMQKTEDLFLKTVGKSGSKESLYRALHFNFTSYMQDDLLVKVDIASMAFGLEARSPLLDHHFVELAAKIPYKLKLKRYKTKAIFKKALEGILPNEIIYRKKKGFAVPLEHWFRNEMKEFTADILLKEGAMIHQWLKKDVIQMYFDEHCNTKINHSSKLWALLTLELWLQRFFKSE